MTIPVARAWLNAGGPVCKPGGMSSDRAAPTRSSCIIHCKEQSETMGIDPAPVPTAAGWQSATPAGRPEACLLPVRSGSHDAQSDVLRGRALACATTPGGGVPPGPAGVVLVNTLFWKILVTRVNGKMRGCKQSFGSAAASVSDGQQSPIFFVHGDYGVRWTRSRARLSV